MATRSYIYIKLDDSDLGRKIFSNHSTTIEHKYIGTYCHFDGYIEGVGKELLKRYNDKESILSLISGGMISYLIDGPLYYNAWRGEEEEPWDRCKPWQRDDEPTAEEDYLYLFEDGEWKFKHWRGEEWYSLKEELDKRKDV
jgi:hypothetical protein